MGFSKTLVQVPRLCVLAAQLAMVMLASPALAQEQLPPPSLQLSFTTPSVVVSPEDDVELWVTLSVSEGPLTFDTSSDTAPFDLHPDLLPLTGNNYESGQYDVAFGSYTSISLFTSRVCNDEVSNVCDPSIYSYTIPADPATWFSIEQPFAMAAGDSQDFLLSTLQPVGGAAPTGSYRIFNVGLGLFVNGFAEDGTTVLEAEVFSASTCFTGDPGCAFTITVVPEPNGAWLMLAGIVPIWLRLRRR
jgi:hypothetical protein